MDLERYFELRTILQQWRSRLADSIRSRIEESPRLARRVQRIYKNEGSEEQFTLWLDRWRRQAAIQFILRILFLRVLEDRSLLGNIRLRATDGQRMWEQLTRNLGAAAYVQWCCWDAAHLLPDLFGPTDFDLVLPADDLVQRFLEDVWRRPDPNRDGWLRFDFRPDPERDDEGFRTRFIGDLYQELDAEIRERYALLQTPDFVAEFILENTLCKRFGEKDFREVTLIDPTCGSGHFVVDAFGLFVEQHERFAGKTRGQLSVSERTHIARQVVEQQLFGCDINPYATALTRFRLTLAACDYARPASLREFRDLRLNIVTIDSLIPYEKLLFGGVPVGGSTTHILGQPEDIERALPVLRQRYSAVVGNPPYILATDAVKRTIYRESHTAASGKFNLSAPFTERFIDLAESDGRVGLIESNAFAQRMFGQALIEEVLTQYDLEAVVDLSGAYIPGHGTPTLILFIRNASPRGKLIKVVANRKSEFTVPSVPAQGAVWKSIHEHFSESAFDNTYVQICNYSRDELSRHPWNLSPNRALVERIRQRASTKLSELAFYLGPGCLTGADEIYLMTEDQARRLGMKSTYIKWAIKGEDIRDWSLAPGAVILTPYDETENGLLAFDLPNSGCSSYLEHFHDVLAHRSPLPAGRKWFEFCRSAGAEVIGKTSLAIAFIATHTHFAVNPGTAVYQRSGYSLRVVEELPADVYLFLAGLLNSSLTCFYLKEVCFDKRAGRDPVRDTYFEFASTSIGQIPVALDYKEPSACRRRMVELAESIAELAQQQVELTPRVVFQQPDEAYHTWNRTLAGYLPHPKLPPPFKTAAQLRAAFAQWLALRNDVRAQMIFLQEEMDWLAYEMYGLLKKAPLGEDYLSESEYRRARLELGQRSFEVVGNSYKGDWPSGYQPPPLPEAIHALTDARIAIIKSNPDIAILEDPLYKRRWVPPDYEQEFREAAEWWLAEKLEWTLEPAGRPLSLREWARLLRDDDRICATLEVLTGNPNYDLEQELLKVIRLNAVPNRPEHYLKPAGLRKIGIEAAEFASSDFADPVAWRVRGKLNIPRERFIYYAEFDHSLRGAPADTPETLGPWFGWAGWDAAQRADALAHLLERAGQAGWEVRWRQCGLRAALRDLVPQLSHLPASDRGEFEAIAVQCGIPLGTACYCQAYREGFTRREPGVPGVGEEVLGVKVLEVEEDKPATKRGRKKDENGGGQIPLL